VTNLVVHWAISIGVFAMAWFLTFIVVLPIGLSQDVNAHGAPSNPRLLMKAGIATLCAAAVWVAFYALVAMGFVRL
jgi:predicted secreted protein